MGAELSVARDHPRETAGPGDTKTEGQRVEWPADTSMSKSSVGVVLPNYNYARYLPDRLASIAAQGEILGGLIFLDDASTDDSVAVADPLLKGLDCAVSVIRNPVNSGSVLGQWRLGLSHTKMPYVWIAEADDVAEPELVSALARHLDTDPDAAFAFADSAAIGPDGSVIEKSGKPYSAAMGDRILDQAGTFSGQDFLRRCLCPRNLVVSASAVLWRTEALRQVFGRLGNEVERWHFAGDWRVYVEAVREGGRVHYDARTLSRHRRHAASVTGAGAAPRHFAEVVALQGVLRRLTGGDREAETRMRQHLGDLRRSWNLD